MEQISPQEKLIRRGQNESVIGSLKMEGLMLDAASAEIGRRFEEGDITLEEFSSAMQSHVEALIVFARTRQSDAA